MRWDIMDAFFDGLPSKACIVNCSIFKKFSKDV